MFLSESLPPIFLWWLYGGLLDRFVDPVQNCAQSAYSLLSIAAQLICESCEGQVRFAL